MFLPFGKNYVTRRIKFLAVRHCLGMTDVYMYFFFGFQLSFFYGTPSMYILYCVGQVSMVTNRLL